MKRKKDRRTKRWEKFFVRLDSDIVPPDQIIVIGLRYEKGTETLVVGGQRIDQHRIEQLVVLFAKDNASRAALLPVGYDRLRFHVHVPLRYWREGLAQLRGTVGTILVPTKSLGRLFR